MARHLALAFVFASLAACASTTPSANQKPVYPPTEATGSTARCEKICDLQVVASTIDAFCDALVAKSKDRLGETPTCRAEGPLGLPTRDDALVRDAMVVDLTVKDQARYAVLALRTERGWELATELGAVKGAAANDDAAVKIVGARPVDAPELSPFGVEVRVRVSAQGESADKIFVCGRTGAETKCPRAIVL